MKKAWMEMMKSKYDTDEEGVRKIMAERQEQSMASPKRKGKPHKAGLNSVSKERLQEISRMGVEARYGKKT